MKTMNFDLNRVELWPFLELIRYSLGTFQVPEFTAFAIHSM